jgi:hypothetical protein
MSSRAPPPPLPLLLSPPLQPSPAPPPPPIVTTEQEELEWAFINDQFINISSDRSLLSNDIIKNLEECDVNGLPKLL